MGTPPRMKLRHTGFVVGAVLLLAGWIMRLINTLFPAGTIASERIDKIGIFISGASVFFLLGGILFYAAIAAKEQKSEPAEQLTEEQEEQMLREELARASYEMKGSIPFTAVYGFLSILLFLSSVSILLYHGAQSRVFGLGGLLPGLLLSLYYIRKLMRQLKWLRRYKSSKN